MNEIEKILNAIQLELNKIPTIELDAKVVQSIQVIQEEVNKCKEICNQVVPVDFRLLEERREELWKNLVESPLAKQKI